MKRVKIFLLLSVLSLTAFGQRYIADSIYLKPIAPLQGKWISVKSQFGGISASDTITRTKVITRKATDSLYLKLNSYKADTALRTKVLTRKAGDSLYHKKTIPFVKGVSDGAKNYIPVFVAGKTDSLGYFSSAYFDNS